MNSLVTKAMSCTKTIRIIVNTQVLAKIVTTETIVITEILETHVTIETIDPEETTKIDK